jgi:hypothetical protein
MSQITPLVIDLSIAKNVELLQAELAKVFPESARYLSSNPHREASGICLAFQQASYQDVSWGWQPQSDCPVASKCYQPTYRPCSLGGRFFCERFSIGD